MSPPPNTETTLSELDTDYRLDPAAAAAYRRDGHVVLADLVTPAVVAAFGRGVEGWVESARRALRPLPDRDTYGRAFVQSMNLWTVDLAVARFVWARRFAAAAAALLGVPRVRLYHDQALFKESGGGHTPWHQDHRHWPLRPAEPATPDTVTMWLPLLDSSPEMGGLQFASGSHLLGDLGDWPIGDAADTHFQQLLQDRGLTVSTNPPMPAGTASFHDGWTLHRALANSSPRTRAVMTVIYLADGTRVAKPANDAQRADLDAWLPGAAPGDTAATTLNPILYPQPAE